MNEKIEKYIKNGNYPPVLLIFGEEEFNIEEAYNKLVEEISKVENAEFNVDILEPDEIDIITLINLASAYPFMSTRRCVVVKHFEKLLTNKGTNKNDQLIALEKYLDKPQPSTFLLLLADIDSLKGLSVDLKSTNKKTKTEKKIESLKSPLKSLIQKHEWIEFPKVYDSEFFNFAHSRIERHGKTATPEALQLLIIQSGQSLREISNEIDKLIIYINDKKNITTEDVRAIIGSSHIFTVFDLQKSIGLRDINNSIKILELLLAHERQEMLILSILTRYFVSLWKLYEESLKQNNQYQLALAAGIPSFFINEYLGPLKKYLPHELDNSFKALAEADSLLKLSNSSPILIMQKMILKIIVKK